MSNNSDTRTFAQSIEERGWATSRPILAHDVVSILRGEVERLSVAGRGGARNLLANDRIRKLAADPAIRTFAVAVLGETCFAVRALLFDKTPEANWKVVWHQDLTIAVREQRDMPGYGPWTEKGGVPHVQPPTQVMEHMLALRVHLDPCGPLNGPVRVIDGSHRLGRLSPAAIDDLRCGKAERDCVVEQGAILGFRPLILHASSPAETPDHRRVIHIEYAANALPAPLAWDQRVA